MSLGEFTLSTKQFGREISEKDFVTEVMQKSKKHPVVVQFIRGANSQAASFQKLIENALQPSKEKVSFFTFNTQKNQQLASQFAQIGMPIEMASFCAVFSEQQVKDVLPVTRSQDTIEAFFKKTLESVENGSTQKLNEANKAYDEQHFDQSCALYSKLLEQEEENPIVWAGFLNSLLKLSEIDACEEALQTIPQSIQDHKEIEQFKRNLTTAKIGQRAAGQLDALSAEYKKQPNDLDIQFKLAQALAGANKKDESVDMLLGIIQQDPHFNNDQARLELLQYFESWGHTDPSTLRGRRKLSSVLFA